MKKIIPFKKQVYFNNQVQEITSISLEHTLMPADNNMIKGDFIVSGEYKMSEASTSTDPFEFYLPCDIELHERYKTDKVQINIDDFYYEIIDSNVLEVNIDVLLDKLEEEEIIINEIPIKHEIMENFENDLKDTEEDRNKLDLLLNVNLEEEEEEKKEMKEEIIKEDRCIEEEDYAKSIFSSFKETEEEYRTYKVYIVREGDSLEQIMNKYQITKEELEKYNNLVEINIGDKIIIPYSYETDK